ncbi:hypothetical protein [Curtobacterium sp. PhB136]|uniref:hypothetical protein n=1 Tax=Curtobacterium sp. PhB136 TaxID=2485181 RepID=UPI0010531A12|nr:hypothetical protein [Curtobacterium sp. PhB136]TCK63071.1 hypothetical protein EDF27_2735 [Curtobacterium sp. PhB136]
MTSVHPTTPLFGRAPIRVVERRASAGGGGFATGAVDASDASDADYEDPRVVAANLERALRAARARLTRRAR